MCESRNFRQGGGGGERGGWRAAKLAEKRF